MFSAPGSLHKDEKVEHGDWVMIFMLTFRFCTSNRLQNAVNRNRNNKLNKVRTVMFVCDVAVLLVNVGICPAILDKKRYC